MALLSFGIAVAHAQAAVRHTVKIEAQPIRAALKELAAQTGLQVVVFSQDAGDKRSPAIQGNLTNDEALAQILRDSGLTYEKIDVNTVAIKSKNISPTAHVATASPTSLRLAQSDSQSESKTEQKPSEASSEASEDKSVKLEEIIVTAQKRAERLQDVPLSVTSLNTETLTSYGATQLTDYVAMVPGLMIESTSGSPGSVTLVVRGIYPGSQSGTAVATTIDDVPVSSSSVYAFGGWVGADLLPYNIDRIEILKGPQGTLYGASALGGLLKYVTRTPDLDETTFRIGTDAVGIDSGDQLGWGVRAAANVPLVPGKLALGISGAHQVTPGYIDNVANGDDGFNDGVRDGAVLALAWRPNERLSVDLKGLYDRSSSDGWGAVLADNTTQQPTYGYLQTWSPMPGEQTSKSTLVAANITYDLDWASLASVSGYSRTHNVVYQDLAPVFLPIFGTYSTSNSVITVRKFSQELRLSSPDAGRLDWMLGTFYTNENAHRAALITALDPTTLAPAPGFDPLLDGRVPSRYKEAALFGNATYELTSRWNIGAGLRYSRSKQEASDLSNGFFTGGQNVDVQYPDVEADVVTYSANTQFTLAPGKMTYALVATGYQSGGSNPTTAGGPATYDASTLTNYEIGFKSEWLDRRLVANLAVYYIDYDNIQLTLSGLNGLGFTVSAGKASSKGIELTQSYVTRSGWDFGLNAGFTDPQLENTLPALNLVKGARLPNSSRWTGSATAGYRRSLWGDYTGRAGILWRYVGGRNSGANLNSRFVTNHELEAYDAFDLSAQVENQRFGVRLYVKNAANKRTFISWIGGLGPTILQPRTIGLSLDTTF